ncbi:serine hydrolase [Legionella fallonii]|uniref:Serine-type D-Ala-D-Ala carboxypeptidase n=1 Tax=Legionella fallonii LLAP-10 TaxID=1212491 RepID=A0A098G3J4_9GAMM|nr:serine hydrolase [Legionella fallonii]CEG56569.1 conserved protein of unknown function [Legionella fallonii LLAP-10]
MNSIPHLGRGDFHTVYQGQSVDDLVIQYMEENNVPGMMLCIVQAPYITRIVGYGFADLETKRLVSTRTVFNIGQLTNAYTAVAIMQLQEEGKLQLDDFIKDYLPIIPESWHAITVKELMIHSSGIPDYSESASFNYAAQYQADELLNLIKDKELLFKPGTQMQTSATNPYLLGWIIEKASGMSYQDYVMKNQIERVGLRNTFFVNTTQSISNEIENGSSPFKHSKFLQFSQLIDPTEPATGYEQTGSSFEKVSSMSWSSSYANSGIVASAEDISIWDIGLAGGILVKDPENRSFLYNSPMIDGKVIPGNVGWLFPGHKGLMHIKGMIPGYSAFLSRFTAPNELVCVTLLANKGSLPDLDVLARKIAAAFDPQLGIPQGSASWSETIQSPYSVQKTIERVKSIVHGMGGTCFAHVDHAAEAKKAKQTLLDTEVIIIGNPAKGTVLMQENPAFALDLPLRIMATQDSSGQVWLSFTDPVKMAKEYHLDVQHVPALKQLLTALQKVCEKAVSAQSTI